MPSARGSLLLPLLAILAFVQPPARAARAVDLDQATIADFNAAFDGGSLTAEALVRRFLARIEAYDRKGPALRAVMTLNPQALDTARALDAERKAKGPRSPLHGIPIVLKDNFDTADLPTTGGSVLLEGSIPPDDAFVVRKLREAGAIVLAKVNLSEFASGGHWSSLGGQSLNPHDLTRSPSSSSGGTGVAIAAAYAVIGLGTDTSGSVRGPSSSNGVVGLKTTLGLVSRDGIIPLALSFDTAGPMARTVYDVAVTLGVMAGVDRADPSTAVSAGRAARDYTTFLKPDALKGARIGVARDFTGVDPEVDWLFEAALQTMRGEGATLIDVRFPKWFLDGKDEFLNAVRFPEFGPQVAAYLGSLGPSYPKTLDELISRSRQFVAPRPDGAMPNPPRWSMFEREASSGSMTDPEYLAVHTHLLPAVRAIADGLLQAHALDAIVYPTAPQRPALLTEVAAGVSRSSARAWPIASLTGYPDLIVPAGFTSDRLPVAVSFLGPAFSEPTLLGLGYAFDQLTRARRLPRHTPALPGETVTVP